MAWFLQLQSWKYVVIVLQQKSDQCVIKQHNLFVKKYPLCHRRRVSVILNLVIAIFKKKKTKTGEMIFFLFGNFLKMCGWFEK